MDLVSPEIDEKKPTGYGNQEYINILLLGETGVGKSTFINSIANYISYKFIDRLEKKKLHVLIPSIYKIKDKDNVEHEINLSQKHDGNEVFDVGASATQYIKSYDFGIHEGRVRVRIIDTPGMCDTKGIQQDEINCERIISYIKSVGKIHGICFLFKPTKARVTVDFEYCMMQILSRLDKSAAKNIVFIFTNTRGSDYGPGDTLSVLQAVIKNISKEYDIDIPLNNNLFCFDNEAFRYLAAVERNIKFDKKNVEYFRKSWEFSAKQCWSLIRYVNQRITPYLSNNIVGVNVARNMLLYLSKISTETSQLITSSNFVLERLRNNRDTKITEIEEMKGKKLDKVTDVEKVKSFYSSLVCTGACAQVYKVGPEHKWHYKVCHKECTEIPQVEHEIIGCPELSQCLVIDRLSNKCLDCDCDFSVHMKIDYETRIKDSYISDGSVDKFISEKDEEIRTFLEKIRVISSRNQELRKELEDIQTFSVKLAQYLKVNALAPLSKSYKEYILYLINQQQILGTSANSDAIESLKTLLKNFEQTMIAFKKASEVDTVPNWQDIEDNIKNLFKLPLNGETIRAAYQKLSQSNNEIKIADYVHEDVFKKEELNIKNNTTRNDSKSVKDNNKIISTTKKIEKHEGKRIVPKVIAVPKKKKETINTTKLMQEPGKNYPSKHSLENVPKNKTVDRDRNMQLERAELKNLTVDELRDLLDEKLRVEKAKNKAKGPKRQECNKGGNAAGSRQGAPPPPYPGHPSTSYNSPYYPQQNLHTPRKGTAGPPCYQPHDLHSFNTNPAPQPEPKSKEAYEIIMKISVPESHKYQPSANQPPYTSSHMSQPYPHMLHPSHAPPAYIPTPPIYPHAPSTYPPAPPTYPHTPSTYPQAPPSYPQHHYYNPGQLPPHGHNTLHSSHGSGHNKNKEQKFQNNDKNKKDTKKGPKDGKPQFKPKKPHK